MNRELPYTEIGDLLVIHDTGAHGFSMGYQYNVNYARQKSWRGKPNQVTRAERPEDYFATLYGFDFLNRIIKKKLKMRKWKTDLLSQKIDKKKNLVFTLLVI